MARKYLFIIKMGIKESVQYRMDFIWGILGGMIKILSLMLLWKTLYSSDMSNGKLHFTYEEILIYTILARALDVVIKNNINIVLPEDVQMGKLTNFLIKPIDYLGFRLFEYIGTNLTSILLMIGVAVFGIFQTKIYVHIGYILIVHILQFLISLLNSLLLLFLLYSLFGILSFWYTEVSALNRAYQVFLQVFCGGYVPLEIYGDTFNRIIKFTPFIYIVDLPLRIIMNRCSIRDGMIGVLVQFSWVILLFFLVKYMWKKGVEKFESVGT